MESQNSEMVSNPLKLSDAIHGGATESQKTTGDSQGTNFKSTASSDSSEKAHPKKKKGKKSKASNPLPKQQQSPITLTKGIKKTKGRNCKGKCFSYKYKEGDAKIPRGVMRKFVAIIKR